MILPSKELLSKVLGHEIIYNGELDITCLNANILTYFKNGMVEHKINVYELMHMMKEWAFDKGYSLDVFKSDENYYEVTPRIYNEIEEEWFDCEYSISRTEFESVTKAAQWVSEQ
jgi:hypothetical protein